MTPGLKETIKSEKNKFFFGDPCYALKDIYYKHWIDWGMDRRRRTVRTATTVRWW